MLRLRQEESRQISLVDLLLPPEVLELPEDLAKLDAWLDDERFSTPFRDKYHQCLGRPSVPAETYLRMTALKHQYGKAAAPLRPGQRQDQLAPNLSDPQEQAGAPSQQSLQDPAAIGC